MTLKELNDIGNSEIYIDYVSDIKLDNCEITISYTMSYPMSGYSRTYKYKNVTDAIYDYNVIFNYINPLYDGIVNLKCECGIEKVMRDHHLFHSRWCPKHTIN